MTASKPEFIADRYAICPNCHGNGYTTEPTERGTTLIETCHKCGGSGHRSMRIETGDS